VHSLQTDRYTDIYLTPSEIERLTGRKYSKYQRQVLAERGWKFEVDADGRPLILRQLHDERLGAKTETSAARRRGPRLEGLSSRRRAKGAQ